MPPISTVKETPQLYAIIPEIKLPKGITPSKGEHKCTHYSPPKFMGYALLKH